MAWYTTSKHSSVKARGLRELHKGSKAFYLHLWMTPVLVSSCSANRLFEPKTDLSIPLGPGYNPFILNMDRDECGIDCWGQEYSPTVMYTGNEFHMFIKLSWEFYTYFVCSLSFSFLGYWLRSRRLLDRRSGKFQPGTLIPGRSSGKQQVCSEERSRPRPSAFKYRKLQDQVSCWCVTRDAFI